VGAEPSGPSSPNKLNDGVGMSLQKTCSGTLNLRLDGKILRFME